MKKSAAVLLISALFLSLPLFSAAPHSQAESAALPLVVDGVTLPSMVAPEVKDGHTMVPLRVVGETIGASVSWANGVVTIMQGETKVVLRPGQKGAEVNGKAVTLEASSYVINSRIMVPLRFVGETLGCTVGFTGGSVIVKTAPFAINGTNVAAMREERYYSEFNFINELRGNYFTKTLYGFIEGSKGEAIEAPAQYTSVLSDVPAGWHRRIVAYDFLDASGKSIKRYEGYVLGEGDSDSLIYDATEDQWYVYADLGSDQWDDTLNTAIDYGFWSVIEGGVTSFS